MYGDLILGLRQLIYSQTATMEQVQYYIINWDLHHCSLLKSTLKKLCEMFSQHFPKIKGFFIAAALLCFKEICILEFISIQLQHIPRVSIDGALSQLLRSRARKYILCFGHKEIFQQLHAKEKKIDKKLSWQAKTPGHRNENTINTHHWGKWKENTMKKWQKPDSLIWMYCGIDIVKEQHSSD